MPIATNQRVANNEIEIQLLFNIAPGRDAEHPSLELLRNFQREREREKMPKVNVSTLDHVEILWIILVEITQNRLHSFCLKN